jgi:hypothetical protein
MTQEEIEMIEKYKKIYQVETDLELLNRLLIDRLDYLKIQELRLEEKNHPQHDD